MEKKKNLKKVKMGKASRAAGTRFELRVREDLESKKWIVDKWTNNVEFIKVIDDAKIKDVALMNNGKFDVGMEIKKSHVIGKIIKAKPKFVYNPQLKRRIPMGMSSGFPDFIALKSFRCGTCHIEDVCEEGCSYEVIGVESKMDGKLDKSEKEKSEWYLKNNIFSRILIASKGEKRGTIKYTEFK